MLVMSDRAMAATPQKPEPFRTGRVWSAMGQVQTKRLGRVEKHHCRTNEMHPLPLGAVQPSNRDY
jgi:hypothetical protein